MRANSRDSDTDDGSIATSERCDCDCDCFEVCALSEVPKSRENDEVKATAADLLDSPLSSSRSSSLGSLEFTPTNCKMCGQLKQLKPHGENAESIHGTHATHVIAQSKRKPTHRSGG